jgi:chorismate mutase
MAAEDRELEALRRQIDELDKELLELLARRMAVVRQVGTHKHEHNIDPLDRTRWDVVIKDRLALAESLGLAETFVAEFYELIHQYALRIETDAPA